MFGHLIITTHEGGFAAHTSAMARREKFQDKLSHAAWFDGAASLKFIHWHLTHFMHSATQAAASPAPAISGLHLISPFRSLPVQLSGLKILSLSGSQLVLVPARHQRSGFWMTKIWWLGGFTDASAKKQVIVRDLEWLSLGAAARCL